MNKLIIIGASGFIGSHLFEHCKRQKVDVAGTYCNNRLFDELIHFDMYTESFEQFLECNPMCSDSVVIVCSADASIDSCKMDEKKSFLLNVEKTIELAEICKKNHSKLIFLSSEAVFDGKKGLYTENDIPSPINVYGQQKYEVEEYLKKNLQSSLILRISRATGSKFGKKDIFDDFYTKIKQNKDIVCLRNQSFCLTEIGDIVNAILLAIDKNLSGLYHISSNNYITRYELARMYAKKMFGGYDGIYEKDFHEINFKDNRQIYAGLDGTILAKLLHIDYLTTEQILKKYVESYNAIKCMSKQFDIE